MDFKDYDDSSLIFSVPIYFRSRENHKKYFDEKLSQYLKQQESLFHKIGAKIDPNERRRLEVYFNQNYYYVWNYTEIIGYIEFRKKKNFIYAFVILPDAERFAPLMNKKKFSISNEFPSYEIETDDLSNKEIVIEIKKVIQAIHKYNIRFRRYYIDTSELKNYINLIDYKNFNSGSPKTVPPILIRGYKYSRFWAYGMDSKLFRRCLES